MLFELKEWQSTSGMWHCGHTASFPKETQLWVVPARILGISPAEFLKILIDKYKPDDIFHNDDCTFVSWSWKSQSQMREYKNWMNAEARKKNFQV